MSKKSVPLLLSMLTLLPLPAFADGAPASVDADYAPVRIEFNTDVKSSPIDTSKHRLELKAGGGDHSKLGTTARVQAAAEQKFIVPYADLDNTRIGVGLSVGVSAKADFAKAPGDARLQLQNVDARALGVSPLVITSDDREVGNYVVSPAQRSSGFSRPCDETFDSLTGGCADHLPPEIKRGFQAELKGQRDADLQACRTRGRTAGECERQWAAIEPTLIRPKALAWIKQRRESGDPMYMDYDRVSPYSKPSRTTAVKFANAQLVFDDQKTAGTSAKGVKADAFDVSGHLAFKVNGLPIDVCAQASMGYVFGAVQTLDRKQNTGIEYGARGCAGVQLGQVGRLGYDYRFNARQMPDSHSGDNAWSVNQSHEVSLRKIAGTPISVTGSIETTHASTGDIKNDQKQVVQAGSARDTSAKFITVGAEF